MIMLSRAVARSFRNIMRRSVMAASPRGLAPPVLVVAGDDGLTLRAAQGEVGLTLRLSGGDVGLGQIAIPGELLSRFEGAGNELVTLEVLDSNKGQARWEEAGVPQVADFEVVDAERIPALPPAARRLTPMPPSFLKTLDDACRTTGREPVRLGLNRLQLRGKAGQLIATDGKQLLVQGGLSLPFGADVLVPALPVFGAKELSNAVPIGLGRSDGRILIRAGSWCFDLQIDTRGRFPSVDTVIPANPHPTRLVLGEADALYLINALPGLPGGDDESAPLTLDLDREAQVRARSESKATEVLLSNSSVTGRSLRISLDRKLLLRALRLGFRTLEVHALNNPLVARDDHRLLVFVSLDAKSVVQPSSDDVRVVTTGTGIAPIEPPTERTSPVTTSNNGTNGHQAEPSEKLDPLVEAEALKTALQEALNCSNRLLSSLRQYRKQRKVVQSAMASLRQLQLTT
jgi:hypothetical protein